MLAAASAFTLTTPATLSGLSYAFDLDAEALFDEMSDEGVPASLANRLRYQTFIAQLKDTVLSNLWSTADCILVPAVHAEAAAAINWKNPSGSKIVLSAPAPTFTPYRGWLTDGTTRATLPFNPTAGVNFTQNSNRGCVWLMTNLGVSSILGWFDGTDGWTMAPRLSTDQIGFRAAQASQSTTAGGGVTNGTGLTSTHRTASNATNVAKNGIAVSVTGNANQTSTTLNNHDFLLGAITDGAGSACEAAIIMFGAALTSAQQRENEFLVCDAFITGLPA